MGFLIDTDLWISVERGKLSAADIHAITRQQPIYRFRISGSLPKHCSEILRCDRKR